LMFEKTFRFCKKGYQSVHRGHRHRSEVNFKVNLKEARCEDMNCTEKSTLMDSYLLTYIHACTLAHKHIYKYKFTCMHTHIHTCAHAHTHIYQIPWFLKLVRWPYDVD
jgi:hypothetical protein